MNVAVALWATQRTACKNTVTRRFAPAFAKAMAWQAAKRLQQRDRLADFHHPQLRL